MLLWYVGRTKANLEFFARGNLRDQAFETLLLTYRRPALARNQGGSHFVRSIKSTKQHALSTTTNSPLTELAPLFPRYIFIRFDAQDPRWSTASGIRWPAINSTRGMTKLLSDASGAPIAVPARAMDQLLIRAAASGEIDLTSPQFTQPRFAPKTPVRITDQNISAVFLHYEDDAQRARVFLSIFGGIETTIDSARLEAAA